MESKIQGILTFNEVKNMIAEMASLAKEKNCRLLLADYSEAVLQLSTVEIYDLPQAASEIVASSGVQLHELKRALVVKNDLNDYRFFETVTLNNGQNAKMFHDIDQAKRWLFAK